MRGMGMPFEHLLDFRTLRKAWLQQCAGTCLWTRPLQAGGSRSMHPLAACDKGANTPHEHTGAMESPDLDRDPAKRTLSLRRRSRDQSPNPRALHWASLAVFC